MRSQTRLGHLIIAPSFIPNAYQPHPRAPGALDKPNGSHKGAFFGSLLAVRVKPPKNLPLPQKIRTASSPSIRIKYVRTTTR